MKNVYVDCQDLSYMKSNSNQDIVFQEEKKSNVNISNFTDNNNNDKKIKNNSPRRESKEIDIFSFFK